MLIKVPVALLMDLCLFLAKSSGAEAQNLYTQLRSVFSAPTVQRKQKEKRVEVPAAVGQGA